MNSVQQSQELPAYWLAKDPGHYHYSCAAEDTHLKQTPSKDSSIWNKLQVDDVPFSNETV